MNHPVFVHTVVDLCSDNGWDKLGHFEDRNALLKTFTIICHVYV